MLETLREHRYRAQHAIDTALMGMGLLSEQPWNDVARVVIVSTGRTGTKFLARLFDRFPETRALHEPKPDFLPLAVAYARDRVSQKEAVRRIEKKRRALRRDVKRRSASTYVESNNRFFSLLQPLRTVWPSVRIVHIVRDGRDYVRSGMSRPWYTRKDRFEGRRMRADMFPNDPYCDQWRQMSRFEKIAWRWQKKDGFIWRATQNLANVMQLRFEDLFKDPDREALFKLARFIGFSDEITRRHLPAFGSNKANETKQHVIPRWPDWDEERSRAFDRVAGKYMQRYYNYQRITT